MSVNRHDLLIGSNFENECFFPSDQDVLQSVVKGGKADPYAAFLTYVELVSFQYIFRYLLSCLLKVESHKIAKISYHTHKMLQIQSRKIKVAGRGCKINHAILNGSYMFSIHYCIPVLYCPPQEFFRTSLQYSIF